MHSATRSEVSLHRVQQKRFHVTMASSLGFCGKASQSRIQNFAKTYHGEKNISTGNRDQDYVYVPSITKLHKSKTQPTLKSSCHKNSFPAAERTLLDLALQVEDRLRNEIKDANDLLIAERKKGLALNRQIEQILPSTNKTEAHLFELLGAQQQNIPSMQTSDKKIGNSEERISPGEVEPESLEKSGNGVLTQLPAFAFSMESAEMVGRRDVIQKINVTRDTR